jgi:hypothetical protein
VILGSVIIVKQIPEWKRKQKNIPVTLTTQKKLKLFGEGVSNTEDSAEENRSFYGSKKFRPNSDLFFLILHFHLEEGNYVRSGRKNSTEFWRLSPKPSLHVK